MLAQTGLAHALADWFDAELGLVQMGYGHMLARLVSEEGGSDDAGVIVKS